MFFTLGNVIFIKWLQLVVVCGPHDNANVTHMALGGPSVWHACFTGFVSGVLQTPCFAEADSEILATPDLGLTVVLGRHELVPWNYEVTFPSHEIVCATMTLSLKRPWYAHKAEVALRNGSCCLHCWLWQPCPNGWREAGCIRVCKLRIHTFCLSR